jgi:HPt (histidine-containing phosphotransfer) domain-containing protein
VEADQNSSSEGPPEHLSSAPVFDLDRAMTRVRGKRSLLSKLGELFLADSPVLLGEIDAAVLAGDGEALERSAHRLRGSAGSLCAPRVAEIAQHLEKMGRDRDLTRADPARRNLESELVCFESAIRDWMKGEE